MKGRLLEMCLFEGGGLSSGWSLIRWSVIGVVSHQVFYQGGLPSGGLSSGLLSGWSLSCLFLIRWSFIRVFSHQVFYQGGLSSGGLSSGLLSGWSLIGSFIRVVSHQGELSPGCFFSRLSLSEWSLHQGFCWIKILHLNTFFLAICPKL